MRQRLVDALRPLDAFSVENRVGPGTPDINFIGGWMECKWLRSWPKQVATPVRLDHPLTSEQKAWLRRRWSRGQPTWVMLQANRTEWLLFDGITAVKYLGEATREELGRFAYRHWRQGLVAKELIAVLKGE